MPSLFLRTPVNGPAAGYETAAPRTAARAEKLENRPARGIAIIIHATA